LENYIFCFLAVLRKSEGFTGQLKVVLLLLAPKKGNRTRRWIVRWPLADGREDKFN
jgi:hypothetical protein